MGEAKHTPGPWQAVECGPSEAVTWNINGPGCLIATGRSQLRPDPEYPDATQDAKAAMAAANARLIANAPTAHEFLSELAVWFDAGNSPNPSAMYDRNRTWRRAVADYLARVAGD